VDFGASLPIVGIERQAVAVTNAAVARVIVAERVQVAFDQVVFEVVELGDGVMAGRGLSGYTGVAARRAFLPRERGCCRGRRRSGADQRRSGQAAW
jgi:hypothetical protein